jgi:multidrug efflux pump subunit AcrA (membrane-fusion protein)
MKNTKEIHNGMDMIDSRDVVARIEYLEELQEEAREAAEEKIEEIEKAEAQLTDWLKGMPVNKILTSEELTKKQVQIADMKDSILSDGDDGFYSDDFGESEATELKALKALADEADGCGDWAYGESLIADSYFETYAREFANDIGAMPNDAQWPCTCIDWAQAASELQQDYASVEFDGVTYWIRS